MQKWQTECSFGVILRYKPPGTEKLIPAKRYVLVGLQLSAPIVQLNALDGFSHLSPPCNSAAAELQQKICYQKYVRVVAREFKQAQPATAISVTETIRSAHIMQR